MDHRIIAGALLAAPAVVAGLYGIYQYRSKKSLFYYNLNSPDSEGVYHHGVFTKVRNVIYRNTLQDRVWKYVEGRSEEGNADSVLAAFDDYCYNYEWTWAIGDKKAAILAKVVQEANPTTLLELGTFLGYSSIIMAQNMVSDGKIITIEADAKSAEVAKKMINRAGFGEKVTVVNGSSEDVIPELHHTFNIETLDMMFLDHNKDLYLTDLHRLEKGGFLHNGSVVFADNVVMAHDFLDYIRGSDNYDSKFYEAKLEYAEGVSDGMERGIFKGADMFSGETLGL